MSKTTSLVGATCALLLLSVLSTSCIQERQTVPEETTPELISPELRTMTFEISLPGVEGVEVKTRQAGEESIQTKEEWKISNLYLLEFAADGSHTLVREHIPLLYEISNGVHKAEGLEYDGSKVSFKYTTKDYDDEMTRIFFFVANVRGHDQLKEKFVPGKTTLADVLSYKLTDLSENFGYEKAQPRVKQMLNQDGTIPMTGFATVSGKDGESVRICPATTSSVSVKLVRLLARIDVVNRIPGFKVEWMDIFNAASDTYLYDSDAKGLTLQDILSPGTVPERPAIGLLENFIVSDYRTLEAPDKRDKPTSLEGAFYITEGGHGAEAYLDQATSLHIKALYEGERQHYDIPFSEYSAEAGREVPLPIRRNTRYTVYIGYEGSGHDARVSFKIKDEDWTVIDQPYELRPFEITGEGHTYLSDKHGRVDSPAEGKKYDFAVFSPYADKESTYTVTSVSEQGWISAVGLKEGKLTFTVGKNTGAARRGRITLTLNRGLSTMTYVILVKQAGV